MATIIIQQDFSLEYLSNILHGKGNVATRFLWLLSEIGKKNPKKLLSELPYLLDLRDNLSHIHTEASFVNYWLIAGVPLENEGKAIQLLFNWIQSTHTNATTKSRAKHVLIKLSKKYPDLKNEINLSLKDHI